MQAERLPKQVHEHHTESNKKQETRYIKTHRFVSLKFNEMLFYLVLVIGVCLCAYFVLTTKFEAHEFQREQAQISSEIDLKEKEIDELTTEVTHLSSYERIYEKAEELGLKTDNGNVKVVKKYEK